MYAEALGVAPELEELAKWVQWAKAAHEEGDTATTAYNLQQFWNQKDAFLQEGWDSLYNDVVFLDAQAKRCYAWMLWRKVAQAETREEIATYTAQMIQAFKDSSDGFSASGHPLQAAADAKHTGDAEDLGKWSQEHFVDATYITAVREQATKVLEQAGDAMSSAGDALAILSNPLVIIGGLAIGAYLYMRKK